MSARFTLSVVSNSIYNVDPKVFDGSESEILARAQAFLTPSKKFMIFSILYSIYPFLTKYFKMSFTQPGSEKFFLNLMMDSMRQREASGVKNLDYLEYLMGLKHRKEIDGKLSNFSKFWNLKNYIFKKIWGSHHMELHF